MKDHLNRRDFLFRLGAGTSLVIAGFITFDQRLSRESSAARIAKGDYPSAKPELSAEIRTYSEEGHFILSGKGHLCSVNKTGEKMIGLLNGEHTVSAISSQLATYFSVEHTEMLETAVAGFICQLAELGMLSAPFYVTMYEA
ncbi:MAG: PqqD family peptide modification chaperone [Tannerellaceae bacterium]|jgi:hypothetical protein|nr:PqqD family peptide modification chaperone [Tannerellaceae bacterium]